MSEIEKLRLALAEEHALRTEIEAKHRDMLGRLHDYHEGDVWIWAGDGTDNPESLVCTVAVTAEQVRAWVKAEAEAKRLKDIIERDRTRVADGMTAIDKAIHARSWMTESRGSYEYDDERYQKEFGEALGEIESAMEPLRRIGFDFTDAPETHAGAVEARSIMKDQDARREKCIEWLRNITDNPRLIEIGTTAFVMAGVDISTGELQASDIDARLCAPITVAFRSVTIEERMRAALLAMAEAK